MSLAGMYRVPSLLLPGLRVCTRGAGLYAGLICTLEVIDSLLTSSARKGSTALMGVFCQGVHLGEDPSIPYIQGSRNRANVHRRHNSIHPSQRSGYHGCRVLGLFLRRFANRRGGSTPTHGSWGGIKSRGSHDRLSQVMGETPGSVTEG